ncbi:efflux RND transporter periplasmic adaptor subunit [Rubrivivax gelatinosus]|uniref:Efflux transporter periplasmic adaptor subunit n=1 Tax=Rubrivivax gelatinosus TaxID=28068 RepID=A0ABS1DZL8_RUBGE|nr:efflux RND transporter periplasmic adaptor subunit [Rubrivivax gelatinosus]MBK1714077.1 efflux transporter periplasmic adaptor subunit [Rubrivivax gelatinosus]
MLSSLKAARGPAPRRRGQRWIWLGVGIAVALALVTWTRGAPEVQATSVTSAYPSARFAELNASGYVVAQRRAAVASKATGRLIELRVREGSVVKAGDLIGRIDAADVVPVVMAAEAGVRQADASRRQAAVELANARADLERTLGLKEQGFVSPQAVDAAQRRTDAAAAALAATEAALAQTRAQLKVQQVGRDNTEIRAPFDGVVLNKNANVGDLITPLSSATGALGAVVTMADMSTLEVEADVSEANVGRIRIDQPVEIALDALPDLRLAGSVARIVPTVDRAKATVMTKIRFERLDPRILPEMAARVVFLSQPATAADRQPVLALNPKAVVERDGRRVVLRIAADGRLQAVPVTPGRTLGDMLEIAPGALKAGERVVLAPAATLSDGTRVTVAK